MMKYIKWCFLLLWMVLIFFFSSQNGTMSSNTSQSFLFAISQFLPFLSGREFFIRKCAHFFLYFVLGILVYLVMKEYTKKPFFWCVLFCFFYACSDEMHQFFIANRSGNVFDVLLDSVASSISLWICFVKQPKI